MDLTFATKAGELLKFSYNGDIYVRGRLTTNDKEVTDWLREAVLAEKKVPLRLNETGQEKAKSLITQFLREYGGEKEYLPKLEWAIAQEIEKTIDQTVRNVTKSMEDEYGL